MLTVVPAVRAVPAVAIILADSPHTADELCDEFGAPAAPFAAVICTVPSGKIRPPEVLWMAPATVKGEVGVMVPMPTLPLSRMRTRSTAAAVPLSVVASEM
jgi:hypothetical protein